MEFLPTDDILWDEDLVTDIDSASYPSGVDELMDSEGAEE